LSRAVGFAVFRVQQDEIDVGAEIQLAAAELAHCQNHQRLGLPAVHAARCAVAGDQSLIHICIGEADACVGERGKIAQGFVEIGPTRHIAPRDPHHVPLTELAQRREYFRFVGAAHALANLASKCVVSRALEECAARAQLTQ
jgi:hypothetical protein